jgi:hypothetical protein
MLRDTGKNPRPPAAVPKPAANAGRRVRASRGRFSGNQRNHVLSHALRRAGGAAATARAKRILTMGACLTATGIALGLVAIWAALATLVV